MVKIPTGEAYTSPRKNRSQPVLRTTSNGPCHIPSPLSPSQLLQWFEQLCVIIHKLCDPFVITISLLQATPTKAEGKLLLSKANSLLSQFENSLSIGDMYRGTYPAFRTISTLLSPTDQAILISKTQAFSTQLWQFLSIPSSPQLRHLIIRFISGIDHLQSSLLLTALQSIFLSGYLPPPRPSNPSVIWQVTHTEITIDPFLLALQKNYYYPLLDFNNMISSDQLASMQVDTDQSSNTSSSPKSTLKKMLTVEDSVAVITELISEIQASDPIDIDNSTVSPEPLLPSKLLKASPNRFSLAKQKSLGPSSMTFLPLLRKFFHALLCTCLVSILPVWNDSKVSTIRTT
jgi:hypothetical protein